jgi:hypothetical protein
MLVPRLRDRVTWFFVNLAVPGDSVQLGTLRAWRKMLPDMLNEEY